MDDSKLRALLTAVQCGSFGKAAAQLGYTQSAMTHLANKLEAELGCTLLTRGSHGVCLSEEGEHLLPYINQVISACDALRSEAEVQGELYGRKLCIGCFASIARSRLPELLRKFRKLHPEIKVDVLVQANELAVALEEGRVQLALVDELCAKGFHWLPLTDAPLIAVVPPDFPWEEKAISLERLLQESFISSPEQYVESLLPSVGIPGVKMGLANIAVIFALFRFGWKEAAALSLVRVVLVSLLFGSVGAMLYSLAGAVLSLAVMALLRRIDRFSTVGISVAGGVAHNAGQILMAMLILQTKQLLGYLPVLAVAGIAGGVLTGLAAALLIRRIPEF